jgi:hypothetical protein
MNVYTKKCNEIINAGNLNTSKLKSSSISKISSIGNNAFSLLAGPNFSCGNNVTDACKNCYAMKNRHHFPNVQKVLASNWVAMKKFNRYNAHRQAVNSILQIIPKNAKIFRIHESGEMFSQWYLNIWTKVIRSRRDVKFWAYTRNFHLNYQYILRQPNFNLLASTDKYNIKEAEKFIKRYISGSIKKAYGPVENEHEVDKDTFVCPATNGRLNGDGACERCMLCVVKNRTNKNVAFIKH